MQPWLVLGVMAHHHMLMGQNDDDQVLSADMASHRPNEGVTSSQIAPV